jgi:hypothetical protein
MPANQEPQACVICGGSVQRKDVFNGAHPFLQDCIKQLAGRVSALEAKGADHGARIAELEAKNDPFLQQVKRTDA